MKTTQRTPRKRFNIVDFAIIAILILAVLIVAWKLISARNEAAEQAQTEFDQAAWDASPHLLFTVEAADIPADAAQNIENLIKNSTDNQIFNANKRYDAFITDCSSVPTAYTVTAEDGSVYDVEHPETCRMSFTVEALLEQEKLEKNELYSVGNQEIRIGKSYILKTVELEVNTIVTALEIVNE